MQVLQGVQGMTDHRLASRNGGIVSAVLWLSFVAITIWGSVSVAHAANPIFGTVQANGPAWTASNSGDWRQIVTTRPLVAGDGLRTGDGGYMLLDLGSHGIVGLYDRTEVSAIAGNAGPSIDVSHGKLAFHIEPESLLTISAVDAEILAPGRGKRSADGYIEINDNGDAVVAVEEGELTVAVGGDTRKLAQGQRMLLNQTPLGSTEERLSAPALPPPAPSAEPVKHQQFASSSGEVSRRDKAAGITEDDDSDAQTAVIKASSGSEAVYFGFTVETASVALLGTIGTVLAIDAVQDDSNGSP